jgi:hypothetical protein
LYNKILLKSEFGQAHCIGLFKWVNTKFTLQFLDIPSSFYKFWKVELFLGIFLNRKEKKNKSRRCAGIFAQGLTPFMAGSPWRSPGQNS